MTGAELIARIAARQQSLANQSVSVGYINKYDTLVTLMAINNDLAAIVALLQRGTTPITAEIPAPSPAKKDAKK